MANERALDSIGEQIIDNRRFIISRIVPNSPAALAGWALGDRIVAVNDHTLELLSMVEIETVMMNLGDQAQFTLERADLTTWHGPLKRDQYSDSGIGLTGDGR